jgi:type I restriction-modification system DNA methylase subunit
MAKKTASANATPTAQKKKTIKKQASRKKKPAPKKSFEQTLWDTADKLRGTVESSEYKHVALSLIFLKFVSDRFQARRQERETGAGQPMTTSQKFTEAKLERVTRSRSRQTSGVLEFDLNSGESSYLSRGRRCL